jgi:hypothetical protein
VSKKPSPKQPVSKEEADWRRSMAFNAEAARAGIFAAMLDIHETMNKQGVPQAAAAVMTGAIEAAAQLWVQVSMESGIPVAKSRRTFLGECQTFFSKHLRMTREGVEAPTKQ